MNHWTVTSAFRDREAGHVFSSIEATFALTGDRITRDKISQVIRVNVGSERYYVKRYIGSGVHPRRLLTAHRAEIEWMNLQRFAAWGIPTAMLVAFGQTRKLGVFIRGALVTEEIQGTIDLESFARQQTQLLRTPRRFKLLSSRIASIVRTLHQHGFTHNDLHWRNLLYRPDTEEVFLIDCPSGGFWWGPFLRYRIVKDLASLDKVARRFLSATHRLRFYLDYAGIPRLREHDKQLIHKVLDAYRQRRRRKGMTT